MRDNYRSPAFFPIPRAIFLNFSIAWFEGESSKKKPRFLPLPVISEKVILDNRSHCTGATCDIYRRATIFHASRPMVNTRYLRMQTYRHTQCVQHLHNVLENSQRPLCSVSLLYVAQYHAIAVRLKVTSLSRNLPAISALKKKRVEVCKIAESRNHAGELIYRPLLRTRFP